MSSTDEETSKVENDVIVEEAMPSTSQSTTGKLTTLGLGELDPLSSFAAAVCTTSGLTAILYPYFLCVLHLIPSDEKLVTLLLYIISYSIACITIAL